MIGDYYIVEDMKHGGCAGAMVIDSDLDRSKRIRLQTGENCGEVLHSKDYRIMEKCAPGEAPALLAATWAETWME